MDQLDFLDFVIIFSDSTQQQHYPKGIDFSSFNINKDLWFWHCSEAHLLTAQFKVKVRSGLVYRELQPASSEVALAIVWRKNSESSVLQAFLSVVRKIAALSRP
ncbi:MAG: hypothetical protein V7L29_30680 [Nostoc sp.]|uniref:hypothetical protein n=1 Tax=Nostoc sp. TaxID=1180 RepID=UPI002FF745CC